MASPRRSRWSRTSSFQFLLVLPCLLLFYLFILAGVFGTPVGNRNIMVVSVWILWWVLLISLLVPLGARLWCTICPIPVLGEWLQRGALIRVRPGASIGTRNRLFGLNRRWPRRLDSIWLQNLGFVGLAIFSVPLVTRPIASVVVLGGMIVVSTAVMLVFRQRAFCKYLCPVGGFLGLYSMTSPLELRAKDRQVCRQCRDKNCILGSETSYACPWSQFPGTMSRNNYCGLCGEYLKGCPHDNIALNLRPFGSDTRIKDAAEAWKALIMVVLAGFYAVTLLGPWGTVKDWANVSEVGNRACSPGWPSAFHCSRLTEATSSRRSPTPSAGAGTCLVRRHCHGRRSCPSGFLSFKIGLLIIGLVMAVWATYTVGRSAFASHDHALRGLVPMSVLFTLVTTVFLRLFAG